MELKDAFINVACQMRVRVAYRPEAQRRQARALAVRWAAFEQSERKLPKGSPQGGAGKSINAAAEAASVTAGAVRCSAWLALVYGAPHPGLIGPMAVRTMIQKTYSNPIQTDKALTAAKR